MEPSHMDTKAEGQDVGDDGLTCQELVELVTAYQEGMLTTEEHVRFDAHLADCPPCLRYVEQIKLTIYALGGFNEQIEEQIEHTPAAQELLRLFRSWKAGPRL